MAFHVRDETTDRLVRELASRRGIGITEAVRTAVENELAKEEPSLWERTADIRERVKSWGSTGLEADKAFYDGLWGEED